MRRTAVVIAVATMALTTLTGCGSSPYCQAIEDHESTLNTLGQNKTNKAYRKYTRAYRAVAAVAPADVRKDWSKLAAVTNDVLKTQRAAGVTMQDVQHPGPKWAGLSHEQQTSISDAYDAFNNTDHEREAVVKNAKDECGISLS